MLKQKLRKIGDSKFFLMPSEYVKVYDLDKYEYELEVDKDGELIQFKRSNEIPETEVKEE